MTAPVPQPYDPRQQQGAGVPPGTGPNGQEPDWAAMAAKSDLDQVNGMTVADALIWYNQQGIAAYPAHPTEKMLARPGGYHFDELGVLSGDQLAAAYQAMQHDPRLRVAIPLGVASGLMAIDADDPGQWARLCAERPLPGTATADTGDEGHLHLLYQRGDADEALLKQGPWSAAYPRIEVKTKQMIIAAPSVHESGVRYQWRPGSYPVDIGEAIEGRMPPRIDCGTGSGPESVRAVQKAVDKGKIPRTYQVAGRAVMLWESRNRETSVHPLPAEAVPVGPPELLNLLAHHTFTFRLQKVKNGSPFEVEHSPQAAYLSAVLANRSWDGLRPLNGVIGAPVLRPDGTLLQEPGYDPATGLYLATRVQDVQVHDKPSERAVAWARQFLLNEVLGDFPWVGLADKANYLAMLVTQVLRYYLNGAPVPFFPVTAPAASSGKTLLVTICGVLFGQASVTWTGDDEELRKTLTSVMASQEGVITFDNVPEGTSIRSAVLSKLLTDRTWGDRMLGKNVLGQFANDRLWCATGNNLRLGGDMPTRVVLVALDPRAPNPERRGGFVIGDLESWIREPEHQQAMLAAVLVLVMSWAAAGCPEADVVPMRQFTRWARACGGLLAHHGVGGFLANAGEAEAADDDSAAWAGFLARWQQVLGTGAVTSEQVASSAWDPKWEGTFPAGRGDEPLGNPKSMGRRLSGQKDNYHGWWVLRGRPDDHDKMMRWWAEQYRGQ